MLRGLAPLRKLSWWQVDLSVASGCQNNGLVGVALVLGDLAVVPGSFFGLAFCLPIDLLCLFPRLLWLLWQDSRAMYPLFTDCTKKGASLAAFSRNACFSRCSWQDLRPMHPFRGAIGRFRIHSARILPGKPPFCVEVPGIMHGAKILPTLGVARASPLRRAADRGRFPTWSRKTAGLSDLTWP